MGGCYNVSVLPSGSLSFGSGVSPSSGIIQPEALGLPNSGFQIVCPAAQVPGQVSLCCDKGVPPSFHPDRAFVYEGLLSKSSL